MTSTKAAKKHIEEIRRKKFSIGVGSSPNPLKNDLHRSVHNLSCELYVKDIHFLMELMQNAEDNEYPEGIEPSLEFIITSKDITGTGAPMTLLVFNNEVGFSRKNMESICSVGQSTKKGRRNEGFVGEKGIGFKSVFLISKQPYIFSNGYQVRFNDEPNQECGIGYIVPEWVNTKPTVADINNVYGSQKNLPTTTIILPLKSEKVKAVKKQLSEVHPELLLFLSKIKQLSVREHVDGSVTEDILSSISISSMHELLTIVGGSTTSYFVQLSAREGTCEKCWYYIWRQVFPVNSETKIDGRKEINEWTITLAFPFDERLTRRALCAGIFAFLPTEMITGFPFIIQADFMLSSSRETILMDNKWNLGILGCVPSMFVAAFVSYTSKQPLQSLPRMFKFLPLIASSYTSLNDIRTTIRTILNERSFLPCEPFSDKMMAFCKPVEAIRVLPEFRKVLMRAKDEGMSLECISTEGRLILHSSIDDMKHEHALEFLGVNISTNYGEWYRKCIHECNLLNLVSEDVYLDLMCFMKDTLPIFKFPYGKPFDTPLVKYITRMRDVSSSTLPNSNAIHYAKEIQLHSWLSKCNQQFACRRGLLLMSNSMHQAIERHCRGFEICEWLAVHKCVKYTTVEHYIESLLRIKHDSKMVILLSHFLYHSFEEKLVTEIGVYSLCASTLPIIDSCRRVHKSRRAILVPAEESKWMKLFGTNPFTNQNYVALGKNIYSEGRDIVGKNAGAGSLLQFLEKYMKALDLPELLPPDVELPISNAHLKEEQAFLLLDWIQHIKSNNNFMPANFTKSIQCGNWMKTTSGFTSPNQSFLFDGTQEPILIEMTKVFANFPVVDESYYKGRITQYRDVLQSIGVKFVSQDSYPILNEQIIHLISSEMTRDNTYKLLNYINYSKKHGKLNASLLKALKEKQWLKTTHGYKSPWGSALVRSKTDVVAQISNLSVVDEAFYGEDIHIHLPVLEFLGVVAEIENVYKQILASFAFPTDLSALKREAVLLLLRCVREMGSTHLDLLVKIKNTKWMKTSVGMICPCESILLDPEWGFLSDIANIPLIDEEFYGKDMRSFMVELKAVGVAVEYDGVQNVIAVRLKSKLNSVNPTGDDVISLLNFIKNFTVKMPAILCTLENSLGSINFLKTRHGFKCPSGSILFEPKWGMINPFVDLPIIDDGYYGIRIYQYRSELEQMGVTVDFSKGSHFLRSGLQLPKEPGNFPSETSLLLLQSLRSMLKNSTVNLFLLPFLDNVRESKWLKTSFGYKTPKECILLDYTRSSNLEYTDGPFLDKEFYGNSILSYKNELRVIGVKTEIEEVAMLMYQIIGWHTNFLVISRIYSFLNKYNWRPSIQDQFDYQVWIPTREDTGNWVNSQYCVLSDTGNLFGTDPNQTYTLDQYRSNPLPQIFYSTIEVGNMVKSQVFCSKSSDPHQIYALDNYYEKPLLQLFSSAFRVRKTPSVNDYITLWKRWVEEQHEVTHDECCIVWESFVSNWDEKLDFLMKNILKLPAFGSPSKDKISLMLTSEICIPDDHDLETLFMEASNEPLFAWRPNRYMTSIPARKLMKIYSDFGVKYLSQLVKFDARSFSSNSKVENRDIREVLIVEGLLRVVLAFLAGPQVRMPLKERHETVKYFLELAVCGTDEPVIIPYILRFPSRKKSIVSRIERAVFWEKKSHKLFVHRPSFEKRTNCVEFVTYFAQEIYNIISQKIVLSNNDLRKLIIISFAYGFEFNAVNFILKKENLQTLVEDEEFISLLISSRSSDTKLKLSPSSSLSSSTSQRKRVQSEEGSVISENVRRRMAGSFALHSPPSSLSSRTLPNSPTQHVYSRKARLPSCQLML